MRSIKVLFLCHLLALAFGLGGLLIALPHPQLWSSNPSAVAVFNFGIHYAGSLHIIFGAATMFCFGWRFIGLKKTLIFFAASTLISLSMELLGTSTGIPFGPYSYTDFLGFKIAGLVPYGIPLSWFYMGLTAYILANELVARMKLRHRTLAALLLGAYFLTVWDLALDPSMASPQLPIHFWVWQESGPYFGMPLRNLAGWSLNGLLYMSVSRWLWHSDLDIQPDTRAVRLIPFGIYSANISFAIALTLSVGIWLPALIAIILGLLPAALTLFPATQIQRTGATSTSISQRMAWLTLRTYSHFIIHRHVNLRVEGLEHIPDSGPVVIVPRHFHHLYDGCILLHTLTRRPHMLVALDWVKGRSVRALMEWACKTVDWPTILRRERLQEPDKAAPSLYAPHEVTRYLRCALQDATRTLRNNELLVIFPEGYPTIDPVYTPKANLRAFLPFRPGFVRIVERTQQDGHTQVAIVPAGLAYTLVGKHWLVSLRFGPALFRRDFATSEQLLHAVEHQVQALSRTIPDSALSHTQEAFTI